ncbi:NAD(P)/FAD-dependent oxidoreductase [Polaribacter sp.]|uniref:NAD(P)/FAD-dependent oxidoreductase n=1 Tax=Polaribacter sp. TaxID=1920175 RepID=UPI004047C25F
MIKTAVCIIGAGPAGAATSLMLSKLKIHHYIIDKETFPRDKTCGDGLILYAYKVMKILGDNIFEEFLNHTTILHSKKVRLHINAKQDIVFTESNDRDMIISYAKRIDFDNFLVQKLSETYTQKEFGNAVKSIQETTEGILLKLKDGKQIFANIIVGADGAQSIVSKKLADNKIDIKNMSTFVSAYFKGVTDIPLGNDAEVRIIYKNMPLFFYIFPLANGDSNISLGGNTNQIKKYNINLIDEIENIISTNQNINHKFTNATRIGKWRGWVIPYHFGKQKMFGNRFLLVGDAAGLANAFYKEGVGTGMMSGIIAAKNIERCLKNNDFSESSLKNYEKDIKKEFGKLLKFSAFMLKLARYKNIFSFAVLLFKNRLSKKSFKIIEKRSY